MFQGLDHVRNAVRILVSHNAMVNQRLYCAASEFSAAMQHPDEWPDDLFGRAREVHQYLTAKGSFDKTIGGMDVSEAQMTAEEIFDISMAVSAASIHEMNRQIRQVPGRKGRMHRIGHHAASS